MKQPDGLIASLNNKAPIVSIDTETYYDATVSIKTLGNFAYCRHPEWECYLITARKAEFINGAWLKHPTVVCHPSLFNWSAYHGHRVYSHNAGFDQTVYREQVYRGLAPADFEANIEGWDCTADFAAYHCNRRSLADTVLFLFGRHLNKAVRDDAKGKRWSTFTDEEKDAMHKYAGTDADECLEIAIVAQEKWPDKERLLSRLTRLQGMRGVQLDVELLKTYIRACHVRLTETLRDIPWAGQINPKTKKPTPPTSTTAYCAYCRSVGVPTPPVKANEGEEAYIKWEAAVAFLTDHTVAEFVAEAEENWSYCDKNLFKLPWVVTGKDGAGHPGDLEGVKAPWFDDSKVSAVITAVSTYRSVNKFLGQLETLLERIDENGVFHFSIKYAGAHTLRWSGDAGFNMQNIMKADANDRDSVWAVFEGSTEGPILHVGQLNREQWTQFAAFETALRAENKQREKEKKKPKPMPNRVEVEGLVFLLIDMRALFIPRKGKKFVIADSSQIEPRCLAFLTKDRAFIELVRQGIDIYEAHARTNFGFTGPIGHLKYLANEVKDTVAIVMRKRAKAERLGLGYQAGPKGYQKAAALLAGLVLTLEEAYEAVKNYRMGNPLVVGFWGKLQTALESHIGRTLKLRLPSGRVMSYRAVQTEKVRYTDPDTNETKWKNQFTAETDGRRHGYYGGKLTENVTQATARDVFSEFVFAVWNDAYTRAPGTGYAKLLASLEEAPLWTVHDEMIVEYPEQFAALALEKVIAFMRTTPDYMGDTPFDAEGSVASCYLK